MHELTIEKCAADLHAKTDQKIGFRISFLHPFCSYCALVPAFRTWVNRGTVRAARASAGARAKFRVASVLTTEEVESLAARGVCGAAFRAAERRARREVIKSEEDISKARP